MNRFVIGTAALLAGSSAAHAALLISAERTGTNINGFDEITFRITGYTGANASSTGSASDPNDGGTDTISGIAGTFSAVGSGAELSFPGTTATQIRNNSTNADGLTRENPPRSYANFDASTGTFTRTPNDATPVSLSGTWFTSDQTLRLRAADITVGGADDGFDQTMLAQVYVTPGADVAFDGVFNSYVGTSQPLQFTSVPEPGSAFALTGAGCAALLCRRQRRGRRPQQI